MNEPRRRILLGVTADMSIRLMRGFPQYLANSGWDVHVVSSPGPLLDELDGAPGVTTHSIAMARKPAPLADLIALGRWILLLARLRPDVTSVGTPKAGLLGGLASLLMRVPSRVYLVRGLPLESAAGASFWLLRAMERLAFATAHSAVAVSPSLKSRVLDLGLVRPEKISVLGAGSSNGVDLVLFDRARADPDECASLSERLGLDAGVPVIGFVGRLTADKGLVHLADARAVLEENGIDHQLLVVGGIDDGAAVPALKRLRGTGRAPIETGHVRDTVPFYHLMDILCLPTRREGFPNVVLEAAAAGVPAVTTDATGAVDSVIDGVTGFVTNQHSPKDLARALTELMGDASKRHSMGAMSRRHAEENYGQVRVWSLFENYYSQSLRAGSKAK